MCRIQYNIDVDEQIDVRFEAAIGNQYEYTVTTYTNDIVEKHTILVEQKTS